jgi:hypothetical protein
MNGYSEGEEVDIKKILARVSSQERTAAGGGDFGWFGY